MFVPRLRKARRLLRVSGKAPRHKWDYYSLTKAQNKMEKGLFFLFGPLCSRLFHDFSTGVCEIGSTGCAKEYNRHKDYMSLDNFHPERDSEVIADTAAGWNKRD